jgi:phosphatidate cytidylyltransferase
MTRNTVFRLLVFFLGIPLLGVGAFAGREIGLPIFGALVIGASALAAREAAFFFPPSTRTYPGSAVIIPLVGAVIPAIGYLSALPALDALLTRLGGSGLGASALVVAALTIVISLIMAVQVLKRREAEINDIVPVVTTHLFLLVYPGLFTWHAARLVTFTMNSELILLFILTVYLNDSLAWFFGRLFGGIGRTPDSPPIVAVSPNKSAVGFIAGFLASVLTVVVAGVVRPDVLPGSPPLHIAFGMVIGAASIIGDLVESGLKRSAAVKDSGQLIPGRGGLLDSIDSPLFAAPFFFYGCVVLYTL